MNTNMKRLAAAPIAITMALVPTLSGCGDDLGNPLDALCCSDFKIGADLSGVDWGLDGQANVDFGLAMQAIGDFSAVASAVVTDLGTACRSMAVDMGEDENAVNETDSAERAKSWCALAASAVASLKAEASLTITFQEPKCSFSASAQANCEASCTANVECEAELGDVSVRCEGGELSGKCEGTCSGKCEGSANLAVACEGTCEGSCEGECQGGCEADPSGANCTGECSGTCNGECKGSCTMEANAEVECSGSCDASCSVELKAPKCDAELTPPSAECSGSAECGGSCEASASAKAECTPPALTVEASGAVSLDIELKIAALKLHLPQILLIARARGELLVNNAQAVLSIAGNLDAALEGDATAVLCIVPAVVAIGDAVVNAEASLSASVSVVTEL